MSILLPNFECQLHFMSVRFTISAFEMIQFFLVQFFAFAFWDWRFLSHPLLEAAFLERSKMEPVTFHSNNYSICTYDDVSHGFTHFQTRTWLSLLYFFKISFRTLFGLSHV